MRDGRTAPVTYRVHLTRPALLVAALGVLALGVGFLAPLSAEAGDHQGGGVDVGAKPWVCHPVEGAGEASSGWNLIDPSKASSHIDEATGAGKHTRKDGSTDVYAVWTDGTWTCPGSVPPTTTTATTSTTTTTPPTTEPPTTEPPTTSEPPTATTTAPSTETPGTGATVPSTTSSNPLVPGTTEGETPEEGATVAPTTPRTAAGPEVGAVQENAVPQAHTDGADLVGSSGGWTGLQAALVGAGLLMVASGGLMTVRREPVDR
ncbi:hypothetical protein SAMN05216199_1915 [Pedococcus cremeus]|uniref:Uncharacterized protein n=1 Tax=Pedococcus cremeus TaxID=587636 RepID=A0A1H9UHI7_9MICO|nr:hypothetical protein [Pedococcus cremeus]SES08654.1 hypothetical protein SAMN05216199_1915 [Pedococcus cremeus]